ncbi:DUF6785 family protein [Vibrio parahaemolyticus]|uniref:DUF6785 family protein n=3 Tax=Vibrio parahaemolyticus TaxID=670 RepID=UPI00320D0BA5
MKKKFMRTRTTNSKKYGVIGWLVYVLSLLLGKYNHVDFALIGFTVSYVILFLWIVHYEMTQLDKGLLMILYGACFVVLLTAAVEDGRQFSVPEQAELSFVVLIAVAGSTFFGGGGSMIANVATKHSSDTPDSATQENALSLTAIETQLKTMRHLLWILIALLSIFTTVLTCLFLHFLE